MSTVTPIQPAAPTITQAHRDAIVHIQDLAITISLQGVFAVFIDFAGHVQWLDVSWRRYAEMQNGNHKSDARHSIRLPGLMPDQGQDALPQLQALARKLEDLLTPPTGDDAA